MKHNEITRELLSRSKYLLKELHNDYGFDFEKDSGLGRIGYFRIDGSFTLPKIRKLVTENGFTKYAEVIVFVKVKTWSGKTLLKPVRVNMCHDTFSTPILFGCDTYWRKADFNEDRKAWNGTAFVIAQDDISKPKHKCVDSQYYLQRFRLCEVRYEDYDDGRREVDCIKIQDEIGNRDTYYPHHAHFDIKEVIDGSGYLVEEHREALKKRLDSLKEKRAKEAYSATNNSNKVAKIDALISARKTILMQMFEQAKTYEDLCNVVDSFSNFRQALRYAEDFKEKTEKKSYESIEHSEAAYSRAVGLLMKA